jgi:hypothetical protein
MDAVNEVFLGDADKIDFLRRKLEICEKFMGSLTGDDFTSSACAKDLYAAQNLLRAVDHDMIIAAVPFKTEARS